MQEQVDPTLPESAKASEQWGHVVSRSAFANILILDTTGKLSMMTREQPGQEIDFGDEIREKAKALIT